MSDRTVPPLLDVDLRLHLGSLEMEVRMLTSARRVAVVGPSGAGKSTLLRVLAGLEGRARGTVSFMGETWMDSAGRLNLEPWRRRVGWVPQDTLLFPHLSVRDNLLYPGGMADEDVRETADLLQAGHLLERRPAILSGGERQRVALARALLSRPRLLLLDEPFSAMDAPLREASIRRLSRILEERDLPLVLVSHDRDDAQRLECREFHLVEGHLADA